MLSLPHLVVLFVLALMVFGPQKLPELARMLGKATAEFRKMTNDFRFALEDEVRELERNTRIRDEEIASAALAAQAPVPAPSPSPKGAVPRDAPIEGASTPTEPKVESQNLADLTPHVDSEPTHASQPESVSVTHENPSDDNTAV